MAYPGNVQKDLTEYTYLTRQKFLISPYIQKKADLHAISRQQENELAD